MAKDSEIGERLDRVEEIIDQLDADACGFNKGSELYEEGQQLLGEIRRLLESGSGDIIEIE